MLGICIGASGPFIGVPVKRVQTGELAGPGADQNDLGRLDSGRNVSRPFATVSLPSACSTTCCSNRR